MRADGRSRSRRMVTARSEWRSSVPACRKVESKPARGRRTGSSTWRSWMRRTAARIDELGLVALLRPARGAAVAGPCRGVDGSTGRGSNRAAWPLAAWPGRTAGWTCDRLAGRAARSLDAIHAAVNRSSESCSDQTWNTAESLTLKRAIDAFTAAPAYASFDEQRKGTLKPGMLADLVVLSNESSPGRPPGLRRRGGGHYLRRQDRLPSKCEVHRLVADERTARFPTGSRPPRFASYSPYSMDLTKIPAPVFTTLDGVTQALAAACYVSVGAAAWIRAAGDVRTGVFFAFSLRQPDRVRRTDGVVAPRHEPTPQSCRRSLPAAITAGLGVGALLLFHFSQVFPRRRPGSKQSGSRWPSPTASIRRHRGTRVVRPAKR